MSLVQRIAVLGALVSILLTLCSCSGMKTVTAERPREEAFRTELKKETSSLNIALEASSEDIGRILSQTVRKELYKGSTGTRGVSADVVRNGPITVRAADNYLYIALPITATLSYGMFATPAIPTTLKFKAKATVTPDWKLHTEIYYIGLSDLFSEQIGIGPLSIKPRSIIDGLTQPVQRVISDMADRKISEMFPLKAQVANAWNAAQKPVLLDKNYGVWLKLTPREVVLSPLYAQNNKVKLSVGITTFAEMVVGPEPPAPPPVPLPNLKLVNSFDKRFRIAMNTDLYYRDLLKIASPLLLNKEFISDGKRITIQGLDLYGNGDKVVVKLVTKGSLDGVLYLTGKPRFDPQTNIFSVGDVDFDMQTQSLLMQTADWFLHGAIRGMLEEKLNMDLTQRLEQSRETVQKALANVKLVDHVLLKGNITTLKFSDVLVQKDKISIQVYSEGETGIYFQ